MTDAPTRAAATAPGRAPLAPLLFAVAIFTSAALVFVVQPMVAKLILPRLGGSPAVWNTAMVFFQLALLAGYGYAHALQRVASLKAQVAAHLVLLLAAASFLPLRVSGALGDPDPGAPILWLLGVLALSVGAPFAVLSATAPLLQAWYARVRAGEPDGANPYVLYAASNLGSFAALLAYPLLVEPGARLTQQTLGWSLGYGAFVVMVAGLALLAWRARGGAAAAALPATAPIGWRTRAIWVLLAAAPASLMLGVTAHLSTDVASAPFLWVIPLALYLLTFVFAFQARSWLPRGAVLLLHGVFAAVCTALLPFSSGEWAFLFAIHLLTFFLTALVCHQALADRRPPPDRLTEFYLWLSVGGALGGAVTALVAPVVFDVVREYPLVLVLAVLARPWPRHRAETSDWFCLLAAGLLSAVPLALFAALKWNSEWLFVMDWNDAEFTSRILLLVAAICAFLIRARPVMFAAALAAISVSAHGVAGRYDWVESERTFFGVLRVAQYQEPRLGGDVKMLLHGTTLHGAQASDPEHRCKPMLYYAPTTPIGQAVQTLQAGKPAVEIGVVGLGTGALAAYKRAADGLTYFEIDPLVDRWARDPERFRFISDCADGPVTTVLGDARLAMEDQPAGKYDLLVIDAFSSDAVPTHLLTVEALRGYFRVLKPDGVVLLHLSNRNLEITTPAVASARALDAPSLHQIYAENPEAPALSEASTEALLLGRDPAALAPYAAAGSWTGPPETDAQPWTDDYINVVGALWRELKMEEGPVRTVLRWLSPEPRDLPDGR